jgi:hypothetical protein
MMAGESKPRESLESLRRRAYLWSGWQPAETVQAEETEMDKSAREESFDESGKQGSTVGNQASQ